MGIYREGHKGAFWNRSNFLYWLWWFPWCVASIKLYWTICLKWVHFFFYLVILDRHCYISFRHTIYWFNIMHYEISTTVSPVTICHHIKLLQYYWLYTKMDALYSGKLYTNICKTKALLFIPVSFKNFPRRHWCLSL